MFTFHTGEMVAVPWIGRRPPGCVATDHYWSNFRINGTRVPPRRMRPIRS
jgi:hypothetical protein